ncbi:L-threonate dehydrogenase [Pseudomonas fluorescens]|uniref:L-threonate dehydrogenase n=1 Tax=Pseudomonas fluorescens TaxID=294 RepID=A0A944DGM4_PSEFL|nr:NAD(P)-dependent oxidoreductase [Pseudomonas fluorescens]MBT2305747.1 NAD(P)-dependent oxidoreductase [Pseudomonas fluorescens]MBT2314230.1 NAD(P)-dependent oxidoreductase [Pseudomonas fluorescens]MBT2319278.1 NAD(P)-dependent oxidoreductase [Pseudomonas fluorescens]MBT2327488.1 NAD(P)-dependent oxidoreductase [Pseudomonas fluorescens]
MTAISNIGVVGLGSMGLGMARSLLRAGLPVWGYDIREDVRQAFSAEGGQPVSALSDSAALSDLLFIVVVNAAQTEQLLFGAQGIAARLRPGSVVIACATISAAAARRISERLAEHQVLMLDAPISGGAVRAEAGELTIMASGPEAAFERAQTALAAVAAKVYRLGEEAGQGSQIKLVNQLLAGVHIAAAAEAMAYGIRQGCDPTALYEVISHSAGNSWMFENRVPHLLAGDYRPRSAVDIFVKDLGLVLDSAQEAVFPLPLTASAHQMFKQASASGLGREDDIAVVKIFPGINLPAAANEEI